MRAPSVIDSAWLRLSTSKDSPSPTESSLPAIGARDLSTAGIVAVRTGPLLAEAGLFNGDEPERPSQWPRLSRFGDSWSARVGLLPISGLELQGSHAHVHSPEHRPGSGTDQRKWSLSAGWDAPVRGRPVYGLVEWARTSEASGF